VKVARKRVAARLSARNPCNSAELRFPCVALESPAGLLGTAMLLLCGLAEVWGVGCPSPGHHGSRVVSLVRSCAAGGRHPAPAAWACSRAATASRAPAVLIQHRAVSLQISPSPCATEH